MTFSRPAQAKARYTKRLVALGFLITLGFTSILSVVLWDGHERDRDLAQQASTNVISAISADIERNIELYGLSLQAVVEGVKLPEYASLAPNIRRLVLFDRAATAKDLASITIIDRNGVSALDSRSVLPSTESHAARDYFIVQRDNPNAGLFISRPWQTATGDHVIALSRRLTTLDNAFDGVVIGTIKLDYFKRLFANLKLGANDSATLVRNDGTIIMRSPFDTAMTGKNVASGAVFQRVASIPSGSFQAVAAIDNIERLYSHQHVGDYPLLIVQGTSVENVYAGWYKKALRIGLLMGALCIVNFSLIVFLLVALRKKHQAEQKLEHAANTDTLTGLYNRRRLNQMFDVIWKNAPRTAQPVSLLMIDADNFKQYNDQYGHQAGDAALATIARCVLDNWQDDSAVCARFGGEEFSVLLPGVSRDDAVAAAERLRTSVFALAEANADPAIPTISIGIATIAPDATNQPRTLIEAADIALYAAKRKGRNRVEVADLSALGMQPGRIAA